MVQVETRDGGDKVLSELGALANQLDKLVDSIKQCQRNAAPKERKRIMATTDHGPHPVDTYHTTFGFKLVEVYNVEAGSAEDAENLVEGDWLRYSPTYEYAEGLWRIEVIRHF